MTITDEPMPGVAEPGAKALWVIGRRVRRSENVLEVNCIYGANQLAEAKAEARRVADKYHEVVVVEGTLRYRAWDRDKYPVNSPEMAMG